VTPERLLQRFQLVEKSNRIEMLRAALFGDALA
jgi:hypothetical protein